MQRRSPPKHRHDGTSPLPLGMDWSPPPRKWNGRDTVWPHASRTGWSYCVAIPSWVVLPKSRDSDPVVFYRVHVGVQSPDAVTTTRGVLRRFNDFLRLFTDLKKVFPKKAIPSTPPKGLLRMKSRTLLEERRRSLEEWMAKLLSDIDISRSAAVASFLELEVAARTSFQDVNSQTLETNPHDVATQSMSPTLVGTSQSITSDYGSDTAYEISDIGTPTLGRDDSSEIGLDDLKLDEDLTGPIEKLVKYGMTNIDEGLFMGQTILEQLEGLPRNKVPARNFNHVPGKDVYSENGSKASFLSANGMDLFSEAEISRVIAHARKISNESVGSDVSSMRGSEISNYGIPNSSGGSLDLLGGGEISSSMETIGNSELHGSGGAQLILPLDQRNKMNRILLTLQRRLVTAKTDMEDLIARLYQEIAVKDYLATKVKDLEVELESDRQKSKENLQQAIMIERERVTQMQWDMEELRQKSIEMEVKLKSKSEKDNKTSIESSPKNSSDSETVVLLNDLDSSKQLETLSKQYEELVVKSKADRRVLVKEVKSLRSSLAKMEHELSKSVQEKSEAEKLSQQEKQKSKRAETAKKNLLHKCKTLHDQLLECTLKFPQDEDVDKDKVSLYPVSPVEALDLLTTSDDQISVLFSEAKLLSRENRASNFDLDENRESMINYGTADDELRKILSDIVIENIKLRKRVNCVLYNVHKI